MLLCNINELTLKATCIWINTGHCFDLENNLFLTHVHVYTVNLIL